MGWFLSIIPRRLIVFATMACCLVVIAAACPAALEPSQVLVVANSAMPESVKLADLYCRLRSIPADNKLLLPLSTTPNISRDDYEKTLRQPLLDYLSQAGRSRGIRCLCLIYGVPIRISQADQPAEITQLIQQLGQAGQRSTYRLAIDLGLLKCIGTDFTNPPAAGLQPIGNLFTQSIRLQENMPSLEELTSQINELTKSKTAAILAMAEPDRQKIAWRQLLAIQLDVFGQSGLASFLAAHPGPQLPDVEAAPVWADRACQTQAELAKAATGQSIPRLLELVGVEGGGAEVALLCQSRVASIKINDAAVDSELALLYYPGYPTAGYLPNQYLYSVSSIGTGPQLMTARLDGPGPKVVQRMIEDSVAAQRDGLLGNFYVDAGGKYPPYDQHLRDLRSFLQARIKLPIIFNDTPQLFSKAPDAALYIGWYSLKKYVPAFTWRKGSVGWHIASFEAMDLRDSTSPEWCPSMLAAGAAATIGSVDEPYLSSFPLPEAFFPLLLTGHYTLAECYWLTVPQISWRMMLIGDPLYRPFAANSQLPLQDLPPQLRPQAATSPTTAASPATMATTAASAPAPGS